MAKQEGVQEPRRVDRGSRRQDEVIPCSAARLRADGEHRPGCVARERRRDKLCHERLERLERPKRPACGLSGVGVAEPEDHEIGAVAEFLEVGRHGPGPDGDRPERARHIGGTPVDSAADHLGDIAGDADRLERGIGQADDAIARMAATMSAQAKADLARMDAEDAAEVCS